jgi:hypothetical protein
VFVPTLPFVTYTPNISTAVENISEMKRIQVTISSHQKERKLKDIYEYAQAII